MVTADYAYELDLDEDEDPYETFIEARKLLNMANVPTNDRIAVVGAEIEARILKSKHLSEADKAGDNSALRDAVIGRYAGLPRRSEEHTSELQSRENLVCRLLLEKKNK